MRYRNFSAYVRDTYKEPFGKVCINGGFTCPNRDGTKGYGGCTFCGERGAGDHIGGELSVWEQVQRGLNDRPKKRKFIAYFQSFTSTYAPTDVLKKRYDEAVADERIAVLSVGTRPDCIDEAVADLLASYTARCEVWVELGLQTESDEIAERFHRGYPTSDFERAVRLLCERGIRVIAHIMVGLPHDTEEGVLKTADYLARFDLFGVKIHSVYVMKNTALEKEYLAGRYTPISLEGYVEAVGKIIARLPERFVIHRVTGDCPHSMLVAPLWNHDKEYVLKKIREHLEENNITQGCLLKEGTERI